MAKPKKTLKPPGKAWRAAERYGCDMSLIEINLRKTPQERIRAHASALRLAQDLRRAMANRRGRS